MTAVIAGLAHRVGDAVTSRLFPELSGISRKVVSMGPKDATDTAIDLAYEYVSPGDDTIPAIPPVATLETAENTSAWMIGTPNGRRSPAVADRDGSEYVLGLVRNYHGDGAGKLFNFRGNFTPRQWNALAGVTLGRMGLPDAGQADAAGQSANFSVANFLAEWGKLSPDAHRALFSGTQYGDLAENLAALTRATRLLEEGRAFANGSNPGRSTMVAGHGGTAGAVLSNDRSMPAMAILMDERWLPPGTAAKLITNPPFVRWLAQDASIAARSTGPNGLSSHTAWLAAVKKSAPELDEEIDRFKWVLETVRNPVDR
ncbi:MAG TPA: hypothetical protein VEY95_06385 [Azospirillaceae bacterium]|nr:hypothetical protein [Azospirillaceae bacterium]